ncbi:MAG TPA: SGNH/GDSL hydrolase family protein [Drouetiella sp.]
MVKQILCYGDSNTWGTDCDRPEVKGVSARHDIHTRWTGRLAAALGPDFRVIDEGMPARTTVFDDPMRDFRNGKKHIIPCINSHRPLDMVVIMLGTNDLQTRYSAAAAEIAQGVEMLVEMVENGCAGIDGERPEILIITPAPMRKMSPVEEQSWSGFQEKLAQLPALYKAVASRRKCHFIDSHQVISVDDMGVDGFHFAASAHEKLANCLTAKIKEVFARESVGAVS